MSALWQNIIAIVFIIGASYSGFNFMTAGGTTLQNWGFVLGAAAVGGWTLFTNLDVATKVKSWFARKPTDNTKVKVLIEDGDEVVRDLQSIRRLKKRFNLLPSQIDRTKCQDALDTLWGFIDDLPETNDE
jgi:hypothetical protein